ncbi:MAG TPA: 2-oxo-4-hydroxy-4-carboxy-5-ureidoimidazoline decarboxylase [Candidatus Lustribacter sp.]|jgi:OHCU decarboxylase|nr:2-oxo-4-hydroxy-4-carboxy-5-ureidoimidazoline decarboxylase [Candidatus Lustribacter sp.]
MTTIEHLNACPVDAFVAEIGFAFEDSPWIARSAAARRPFAGRDALIGAMIAVVEGASEAEAVALIRAHPDLAGRVAREGRLTAASAAEQAGAGLGTLSAAEIARFDADNRAYRERFGFPFVICARENTKDSILAALARRRTNERAVEIATALAEIAKIARLRIEDAVT